MQNNIPISSHRLMWVDWMKIIAMFFIIAGHCGADGYKFIYVFSVPCFFVISGFLTKKESDSRLFWKKLWHNLVIPMLLFSLINFAFDQVIEIAMGRFNVNVFWQFPLNVLIGNQGQDFNYVGLGMMWFVYTLCIMKIIVQFVPVKYETIMFTLIIMLSISANIELTKSCVIYNSWADALIALPCYLLGYLIRPYKEHFFAKWHNGLGLLLFSACVFLIAISGMENDYVFLYRAQFGNSYLLYLIGGLSGTVAIYFVARALEKIDNRSVQLLGGGHFCNTWCTWHDDKNHKINTCFRNFYFS